MQATKLNYGDVVQLGPTTSNPAFAFCFMVVTEPKSWGAQGFAQVLGDSESIGGQAYYRSKWEDMELIGRAAWAPKEEVDDDIGQYGTYDGMDHD